jgi:hypothetical protein
MQTHADSVHQASTICKSMSHKQTCAHTTKRSEHHSYHTTLQNKLTLTHNSVVPKNMHTNECEPKHTDWPSIFNRSAFAEGASTHSAGVNTNASSKTYTLMESIRKITEKALPVPLPKLSHLFLDSNASKFLENVTNDEHKRHALRRQSLLHRLKAGRHKELSRNGTQSLLQRPLNSSDLVELNSPTRDAHARKGTRTI